MKTGEAGINLIKQFEGLRLNAYKPVKTEIYYTIGYGHYGADVKANMTITEDYADALLRLDLDKCERAVNSYERNWNQNQFDALVSFTFNCGAANLKKLVAKRNNAQIAEAILLYNRAGGKVLNGLIRRRNAERDLFLKG
jgi:GH24 family phage-related lysozyme (muramidase)